MTHGPASGARLRPPKLVLVLFVADVLILVPLGLLIVWLGALAAPSYWDSGERLLAILLGLACSLMFGVVGLGILRYSILGRPPVRVDRHGLGIGAERFGWAEVRRIASSSIYGVSYLTIELDSDSERRVAWFDRLSMRYSGPPDQRRGPLWVTEQQLGETVDATLRRIPAGPADR